MSKDKIIQKSFEIISRNLGPVTAGYYKKFYLEKEESEILASMQELLSEVLGPKNAKKQMKELQRIT